MKRFIFIILLMCGQLLANYAFAADRFVRAGATGTGTGNDWINAYTTLPPTLIRGDTYYIADGNYGSYNFNDPLSGSSFIYIKKATIGSHGNDTGWNSSFGDGEALFSSSGNVFNVTTGYLDIDGQVGSGKSAGYGFRLYSTANRCNTGTNMFAYAGNITNLALRHVEFDWNNGTSVCNGGVTRSFESGTYNADYITIENNYFHHSSGYVFYLGNYTGRPVQNHYTIRQNYFFSNGGGGGVSYHWELMWLTDLKNSNIYNNIIEDTYGNVDAQTGWVMLGGADTVNIYGNVFFCSSTNCAVGGNGLIATWSADTYKCNAIHIFNNTFVNISGGYGPKIYFTHNTVNDTDIQVKNNLYYNKSFSWTGVNAQSNETCGGGQGCAGTNQQTGVTTAIFVDYTGNNFQLASATSPGDGTLGSQFNLDINNQVRGVDDVWDRGAFEFTTDSSSSPPLPPSNLKATMPP